jgi:hypothetical protein
MQINAFCAAYLNASLFHRPCLSIDPRARLKKRSIVQRWQHE